jgi:hypothetical protein
VNPDGECIHRCIDEVATMEETRYGFLSGLQPVFNRLGKELVERNPIVSDE